jgi:hypothetical protein
LNKSRNCLSESSVAQRCSLAWISRTLRSAPKSVSVGASVFTGVLRAFQHPPCRLAGPLRHVRAFRALGLLRGLRPTLRPTADVGPALRCPGWSIVRATAGGSHVHRQPFDEGGAQPFPGSLATSTPQAFLVASPPACTSRLRSHPPHDHGRCALRTGPYPPGWSRLDAYGASRAGSSRTPSRRACRTRPVWQFQGVPALSGLLSTPPGDSRVRLSSASRPCCDKATAAVFQRRTVKQRLVAHVQIIEPATGITAGPTVQLGLDPQYPALRLIQGFVQLVGIHRRPPGIPATSPPTCRPPSPCACLSHARTTTGPPPHR